MSKGERFGERFEQRGARKNVHVDKVRRKVLLECGKHSVREEGNFLYPSKFFWLV